MLDLVASTMRKVNADSQCLILFSCDRHPMAKACLNVPTQAVCGNN
jgi:hypothetical protein